MYYIISFAPVILILLYSFYLLLKPQSIHDEFFHLSNKTKKEMVIHRIMLLERFNKTDYSSDITQIEKFYKDGRITEYEADKIEEILTNTYFNNFKGKWSAFKHADMGLKSIFILSLVYGFVYVNLVFAAGYGMNSRPDLSFTATLILVNASLVLPFLFSLVLFGFFSMFISMLNLFFPESGAINRTTITSAELIRSLKPGGRKTPVVLGSAWSDEHPRYL